MSQHQHPLEQLLTTLRTHGSQIDAWAHSILSSEALLRYRSKQQQLERRAPEEFMQISVASDCLADLPQQPAPPSDIEAPNEPRRKRANRRQRRVGSSDGTPSPGTEPQAPAQEPLSRPAAQEIESTAETAPQQTTVQSPAMGPTTIESTSKELHAQLLQWAKDPSPELGAELCRLRIQRAVLCAASQSWSMALSDAHHAHELRPKSLELLEQCLRIAKQAGLTQHLEYFQHRAESLSS